MSERKICAITNKHSQDCGQPPQFELDDFAYVSYFENSHAEQSLFLYDSDDNQVVVYLADAGWENPQTIPGELLVENRESSRDIDIGIVVNSEEKMWLKACKSAVKSRISYNIEQTKD